MMATLAHPGIAWGCGVCVELLYFWHLVLRCPPPLLGPLAWSSMCLGLLLLLMGPPHLVHLLHFITHFTGFLSPLCSPTLLGFRSSPSWCSFCPSLIRGQLSFIIFGVLLMKPHWLPSRSVHLMALNSLECPTIVNPHWA